MCNVETLVVAVLVVIACNLQGSSAQRYGELSLRLDDLSK